MNKNKFHNYFEDNAILTSSGFYGKIPTNKDFRTDLRLILDNNKLTPDEIFESIDELHEIYVIKSKYIKPKESVLEVHNHLDFCLKYPETVVNANGSALHVKCMINANLTPILDLDLIYRMADYYKLDSDIFTKFKDIIKDHQMLLNQSVK